MGLSSGPLGCNRPASTRWYRRDEWRRRPARGTPSRSWPCLRRGCQDAGRCASSPDAGRSDALGGRPPSRLLTPMTVRSTPGGRSNHSRGCASRIDDDDCPGAEVQPKRRIASVGGQQATLSAGPAQAAPAVSKTTAPVRRSCASTMSTRWLPASFTMTRPSLSARMPPSEPDAVWRGRDDTIEHTDRPTVLLGGEATPSARSDDEDSDRSHHGPPPISNGRVSESDPLRLPSMRTAAERPS